MFYNKVSKKIKKYPLDWHKHIINTSILYFSDKTINFIDANIVFQDTTAYNSSGYKTSVKFVKLFFEINKYYYEVVIYKKDKLDSYIYYQEKITSENLQNNFLLINMEYFGLFDTIPDFSMEILFDIAHIKKDSPFECLETIEKIILIDYKKRQGGDDEGGEDEDSPIVDPVNSFDLEPELVD